MDTTTIPSCFSSKKLVLMCTTLNNIETVYPNAQFFKALQPAH